MIQNNFYLGMLVYHFAYEYVESTSFGTSGNLTKLYPESNLTREKFLQGPASLASSLAL